MPRCAMACFNSAAKGMLRFTHSSSNAAASIGLPPYAAARMRRASGVVRSSMSSSAPGLSLE
jgi:hypothetical protein